MGITSTMLQIINKTWCKEENPANDNKLITEATKTQTDLGHYSLQKGYM